MKNIAFFILDFLLLILSALMLPTLKEIISGQEIIYLAFVLSVYWGQGIIFSKFNIKKIKIFTFIATGTLLGLGANCFFTSNFALVDIVTGFVSTMVLFFISYCRLLKKNN